MPLQERLILLLENDPQFDEIKDILKSPLGLVETLVKSSFSDDPNENLLKHEKKLDDIKNKIAGIGRSNMLSGTYKVAKYSSYLFAFQQFFHSSYRARQGIPLEEVTYRSLNLGNATAIKTKTARQRKVKELFGIPGAVSKDIDFLATKPNEVMFGQIRSTDVTGGLTAKGSLVELLRFILDNRTRNPFATYLVVVWVPLERQQRPSLINKAWDELKYSEGEQNETGFKNQIGDGWQMRNTNITLKLVYGLDELGDEFNDFTGNETAKTRFLSLWTSLERWDDLWLTYAIASLELEKLIFNGSTNFQILDDKLNELGIRISNEDSSNYSESSERIAVQIAEAWAEDTLPVSAPAEILNYLRDLILLKMINIKVSGNGNSRSRTIQNFL
jgi:hypothetical protein